jgi:DMSO/TMAO reductase YedYZ molybdopterin-dependent catalytic subunit
MSQAEQRQQSHSKRLPPGQQLVAPGKWPIIGEKSPAQSSQPWQLSITGLVTNPLSLSLDQLRSLPQSKLVVDIHCVTRWSKFEVEFGGVMLADLLATSIVGPAAKFVSLIARSDRKHATSLALDTAISQQTLIAIDVDGQPLPSEHGGPIRNIVPGCYFYKSVKWLEEIELLEEDRLGFWEAESGYHNLADPWQEQRYLAPSIDRREAANLIDSKDFSHRDLRGIDASNRQLSGLIATGAALRNANFSLSNLQGADFSDANLSNAHFRRTDLRETSFLKADLEGADLSGADIRGANFCGCSLIGSSFFDPTDGPELGARIDDSTILPDEVLAPLFPLQLEYVRKALGRD